MFYYRPGHDSSVQNGCLDPLEEFAATTGCDGNLLIYKIIKDEEENMTFEMVKKHKISKKFTKVFST